VFVGLADYYILWLDRLMQQSRQAQRITQADARIVDQLRELHRGGELPQVRRKIERQPVSSTPEAGDLHEADVDPTDPPQAPS
jgi:hypothetical protein